MSGADRDKPVHRIVRSITTTKWAAKAKEAGEALKAEYAAGREGDESPPTPIWPTPKEQLAALKRLFGASPSQSGRELEASPADPSVDDADEVADALRCVDWDEVRAATAGRTNDVTNAMRSMAEHVDWAKVQPVAAQVSSALIAAVASGRIPLGGQLGAMVARAISNQNNLGRRVADNLQHTSTALPRDFRAIIDTTATEG
jgi:hypothetical protein